jgi:hypothetical protein
MTKIESLILGIAHDIDLKHYIATPSYKNCKQCDYSNNCPVPLKYQPGKTFTQISTENVQLKEIINNE